MKLAGLVVLVAACHSAVINVERASSGAVEGDVDFEPEQGPDGHYISLPAYPLVNCTDTLVYDKLLDDFFTAASHADAMPEPARLKRNEDDQLRSVIDPHQAPVIARRLGDMHQFLTTLMGTQLARIARAARRDAVMRPVVALARRGSDLAKLQPLADKATPFACIKAGTVTFTSDAEIERSLVDGEGFTANTSALHAERERLKQAFQVAVADALAAVAVAINPRDIPLVSTLALLPANSRTCVPIRGEVVDAVVSFAQQTASDLDLLRSVAPREVFSDGELQRLIPAGDPGREALLEAARDFVRLADSFGTAACASGPRYRDFLGYPIGSGHASWIDRTQSQQEQRLNALESELGVTPAAGWPRAEFAFLHFSDVQIREPGAKFGGTEISGTLRQLESSFEQDYYQGQYAMFVYQAIVATANREWCLYNPGDPACGSSSLLALPDGDRPPPAMMIHTGDSADMGLQSEFDTFLTYTDKLHVPWYQVLGNHDVLAFGNLKLISKNAPHAPEDECQGWGLTPCTCTSLDTLVREEVRRTPDNHGATPDAMPKPWFTPLPSVLTRICILHEVASDWFVMDPDKQRGGNTVNSFVLSHCGGWRPKPGDGSPPPTGCARLPQQEPVAPYYARTPTAARQCAVLHGDGRNSMMHGLDLMPGFRFNIDPQSRDLGYYCFQMTPGTVSNGGRVFAVVLNTNTDAGAFGVLSLAQLSWLRELLPTKERCAAAQAAPAVADPDDPEIGCKDLVLLFAHHPIYSIYDQHQRIELTELVTTRPNVVAMFIGHKHRSDLRMIRPLAGSDGHPKWEVMGPAVIDWPQAAREVILKTHGDLGYFEVLTFTPHGTGTSMPKIRAAQAGAVRDKCRNEPDLCPDGDGRIRQPTRDLTFPRLFFRLPR